MKSAPEISRWQEGGVDRTKEHFELRYGSARDGGWSKWIPLAVVGPPIAGVVNVQFLVEPGDPSNANAISDVANEIQFYLIDKRERKPWAYAQYHCSTGANVYSNVHWSFFNPGNRVQDQETAEVESTAGKSAALTRKRSTDGKKAAATSTRRAKARRAAKSKRV